MRHLLGRLRHSGDTLGEKGPRENGHWGHVLSRGKMQKRESKTAIAKEGCRVYVRVRAAVEADQLVTIRYGTATMTPWSRADQMARV